MKVLRIKLILLAMIVGAVRAEYSPWNNCSGRSTLCIGPLHYLVCEENSNGEMVARDGVTKMCGDNYVCSSEGSEVCVPSTSIESSIAPVVIALAPSETNVIALSNETETTGSTVNAPSGVELSSVNPNVNETTETPTAQLLQGDFGNDSNATELNETITQDLSTPTDVTEVLEPSIQTAETVQTSLISEAPVSKELRNGSVTDSGTDISNSVVLGTDVNVTESSLPLGTEPTVVTEGLTEEIAPLTNQVPSELSAILTPSEVTESQPESITVAPEQYSESSVPLDNSPETGSVSTSDTLALETLSSPDGTVLNPIDPVDVSDATTIVVASDSESTAQSAEPSAESPSSNATNSEIAVTLGPTETVPTPPAATPEISTNPIIDSVPDSLANPTTFEVPDIQETVVNDQSAAVAEPESSIQAAAVEQELQPSESQANQEGIFSGTNQQEQETPVVVADDNAANIDNQQSNASEQIQGSQTISNNADGSVKSLEQSQPAETTVTSNTTGAINQVEEQSSTEGSVPSSVSSEPSGASEVALENQQNVSVNPVVEGTSNIISEQGGEITLEESEPSILPKESLPVDTNQDSLNSQQALPAPSDPQGNAQAAVESVPQPESAASVDNGQESVPVTSSSDAQKSNAIENGNVISSAVEPAVAAQNEQSAAESDQFKTAQNAEAQPDDASALGPLGASDASASEQATSESAVQAGQLTNGQLVPPQGSELANDVQNSQDVVTVGIQGAAGSNGAQAETTFEDQQVLIPELVGSIIINEVEEVLTGQETSVVEATQSTDIQGAQQSTAQETVGITGVEVVKEVPSGGPAVTNDVQSGQIASGSVPQAGSTVNEAVPSIADQTAAPGAEEATGQNVADQPPTETELDVGQNVLVESNQQSAAENGIQIDETVEGQSPLNQESNGVNIIESGHDVIGQESSVSPLPELSFVQGASQQPATQGSTVPFNVQTGQQLPTPDPVEPSNVRADQATIEQSGSTQIGGEIPQQESTGLSPSQAEQTVNVQQSTILGQEPIASEADQKSVTQESPLESGSLAGEQATIQEPVVAPGPQISQESSVSASSGLSGLQVSQQQPIQGSAAAEVKTGRETAVQGLQSSEQPPVQGPVWPSSVHTAPQPSTQGPVQVNGIQTGQQPSPQGSTGPAGQQTATQGSVGAAGVQSTVPGSAAAVGTQTGEEIANQGSDVSGGVQTAQQPSIQESGGVTGVQTGQNIAIERPFGTDGIQAGQQSSTQGSAAGNNNNQAGNIYGGSGYWQVSRPGRPVWIDSNAVKIGSAQQPPTTAGATDLNGHKPLTQQPAGASGIHTSDQSSIQGLVGAGTLINRPGQVGGRLGFWQVSRAGRPVWVESNTVQLGSQQSAPSSSGTGNNPLEFSVGGQESGTVRSLAGRPALQVGSEPQPSNTVRPGTINSWGESNTKPIWNLENDVQGINFGSIESEEDAESVESVASPETVEISTDSTENPESVESSESPESVESLIVPAEIDSVESVETVESIALESTESLESIEESPETPESTETPESQSAESAEEASENSESFELARASIRHKRRF